jgi:hypothetical protein
MTTKSLAVVLVLALSCAIEASCLRASPEPDVTASGATSVQPRSEPNRTEPTGQAPEPMGYVERYGSAKFPFVVWIPDDGQEEAGGWQRSVTTLSFWVDRGIQREYDWKCPIEIQMPIRSEKLGRISASRASLWTAQAATDAVRLQLDSKDAEDWIGMGELFCTELYPRLQRMLNTRHKGLGARVKRP